MQAKSSKAGSGRIVGRPWWRRLLRLAVLLVLALVTMLLALLAVWRFVPPVSTLMLGRYALARPVDRQWRDLSAISPSLSAAVVMAEDGQFCRHNGVDWPALGQVLQSAGPDGPARGASTIAMQTVKNLFLWPQRSFIRKGLEIPLALALDALWPKRRVMETYLNIAEWGEGIFGAEAAARHYFGKSAASLTPHEAALLASALPNPALRNPAHPTRRQLFLVRLIERRMGQAETWLDCLK